MEDLPIRWSTAETNVEVSLCDSGVTVVVDPDGPARRTINRTESELAGLGPAIESPVCSESVGQWLAPWLRDRSSTANWRGITSTGSVLDVSIANGAARVVCLDAVAQNSASRFRHDARGLLNSVGMNADLVGILAGESGDTGIQEAVTRIRRSSDGLSELITDWTGELESPGSGVPVAVMVQDGLCRAGIKVINATINGAGQAPVLWCLATRQLLIEWVEWLNGAGRESESAGGLRSDVGLQLTCDRRSVSLEVAGLVESGQVFNWAPENAAASELQSVEPKAVLGGMSIGFGSWQTRDAAGVCVGIPVPESRSDSGPPAQYE